MSYLPQHLLAQILSKVPIKSLLRFKCVSKSWRSLILDSHFVKSHFNQSLTNSIFGTKKILIVTSEPPLRLYSANIGSTNINNNIVVENIDFLFRNNVCNHCEIIGSCNGLICMEVDYSFMCVFNVSTRESRKIPDDSHGHFGFGYDHCRDDYKLVKITSNSIHVYSLRIGCWRKVLDFPKYSVWVLGHGTELHGAIHWFCVKNRSDKTFEIAAFSLVDEKLLKFPLPVNSGEDFNNNNNFRLTLFEGCLCILPQPGSYRYGGPFWIMKEYGVEPSWNKFEINHPFSDILQPLVLLSYDECLVLMIYYGRPILYNTIEGTYKTIAIPNVRIYEQFQATVYVESLLSPVRIS